MKNIAVFIIELQQDTQTNHMEKLCAAFLIITSFYNCPNRKRVQCLKRQTVLNDCGAVSNTWKFILRRMIQ
jgi:hypothetical protein